MQNSIDVLKRMETESKRFINIEKEGVIEEFHQCVFEEIFRKEWDIPSVHQWIGMMINNYTL